MYHSRSKKLCQMANSDQNTQINNNVILFLHLVLQVSARFYYIFAYYTLHIIHYIQFFISMYRQY